MKKIVVYKPVKKTEEKEHIKNNLIWYDLFYKKMLTFEGTKLTFEYQQEEFIETPLKNIPVDEATEEQKKQYGIQKKYIVRPKVEVHFKKNTKKEVDTNFLDKWFKNYQKYNRTNIHLDLNNVDSCVFSVPDEEITDFENELYRHRLDYD